MVHTVSIGDTHMQTVSGYCTHAHRVPSPTISVTNGACEERSGVAAIHKASNQHIGSPPPPCATINFVQDKYSPNRTVRWTHRSVHETIL